MGRRSGHPQGDRGGLRKPHIQVPLVLSLLKHVKWANLACVLRQAQNERGW